MKTKYINQKIYLDYIDNVVKDLDLIFFESDQILSDKGYILNKDTYQFIAKLLQTDYNDRIKRSFCSLIYKDVYKAELLSANGGTIAFIFALEFIKYLLKNQKILKNIHLINELNEALIKFKKILEISSQPAEESTFFNYVNFGFTNNQTISEICLSAIKLAGVEGKIIVENSKQDHYTVELKNGFNFKLSPYRYFLQNNLWERKECKVLVVDGIVESISEIDQLLTEANKNKQSMAIIAHGFSEEVVATLITNKQKNLLDVIPLRLMPDINSINVINDIGVVCGMHPISHLKGELLTFVKYNDLPTIESIKVNELTTIIDNSSTYHDVLAQIKMILQKRENHFDTEDVQILLENRIKNLSPNLVVIYLPDMTTTENETVRMQIDSILRNAKTLLNYGVVDFWRLSDQMHFDFTTLNRVSSRIEKLPIAINDLENVLFKSINSMFDNSNLHKSIISPMSLYVAVSLISKTVLMLLTSTGFISLDLD